MLHETVATPDPTAICRLDELDLVVTGQCFAHGHAAIERSVEEAERGCPACGALLVLGKVRIDASRTNP